MIITHLKCRIERIFNKGVWNRRLWKTYKTTNSYRIFFFVKEGEGDSTFIQRQIGFFFLSITWVYFCRLFLFFSGTINTSISTVSVCDFIKEHDTMIQSQQMNGSLVSKFNSSAVTHVYSHKTEVRLVLFFLKHSF